MITTGPHQNLPATIVHTITGEILVEDAKQAVEELVEIMESEIQKDGRLYVIINAQGVNFTSLIAHRTWSLGLKNGCDPYKERINYGLMVLDDSLNARAEKELMETDRFKFFFNLQEAEKWLRDKIDGGL